MNGSSLFCSSRLRPCLAFHSLLQVLVERAGRRAAFFPIPIQPHPIPGSVVMSVIGPEKLSSGLNVEQPEFVSLGSKRNQWT